MRGTKVTIERYLVTTNIKIGVRAYDDYGEKINESGYGRTVKGIIAAVFACAGRKKYQKVLDQIIPQLRQERYAADIIRVALRRHPKQIPHNTTISDLFKTPFSEFRLSRDLIERYLRFFAEEGEIRGVELQAGLENIYV